MVTSVVEHHSNLLPWSRVASRRFVECGADGTFTTADVSAELDRTPKARLLTVTGASNVTGWIPPIDEIIETAHSREIPVAVDCAQLAPHRPLPAEADFVVWSGHKMYAPFGAGVLIGPRAAFAQGDPFLAGGGAINLVELDDVVWNDPPDREEAGSPNVVGAVALHAAIDVLTEIGWPAIIAHDSRIGLLFTKGTREHPWGTRPRAGSACRDPARRELHRGRSPTRSSGSPAVGRGGHRRPAWLLLRPPLHDAALGPRRGRGRRLPQRDAPR